MAGLRAGRLPAPLHDAGVPAFKGRWGQTGTISPTMVTQGYILGLGGRGGSPTESPSCPSSNKIPCAVSDGFLASGTVAGALAVLQPMGVPLTYGSAALLDHRCLSAMFFGDLGSSTRIICGLGTTQRLRNESRQPFKDKPPLPPLRTKQWWSPARWPY